MVASGEMFHLGSQLSWQERRKWPNVPCDYCSYPARRQKYGTRLVVRGHAGRDERVLEQGRRAAFSGVVPGTNSGLHMLGPKYSARCSQVTSSVCHGSNLPRSILVGESWLYCEREQPNPQTRKNIICDHSKIPFPGDFRRTRPKTTPIFISCARETRLERTLGAARRGDAQLVQGRFDSV
jgi:hypothetical protein